MFYQSLYYVYSCTQIQVARNGGKGRVKKKGIVISNGGMIGGRFDKFMTNSRKKKCRQEKQ